MPFTQLEMSVDAKPMRTLYSHYPTPESINSSSVRPLGLLRNGVLESKRTTDDEDDHYSMDFNISESDDHAEEETQRVQGTISTTETFLQQTDGTRKRSDERTRQQVFKSRLHLAASRKSHEHKPIATQSTKKRVVQLPMLKLNLNVLTGFKNNEDSKTLESTRRSLKTLLDNGKRAVKQTDIANGQFITSADKNKDQSLGSTREEKLCAVQTLPMDDDQNTLFTLPTARVDYVQLASTSPRKVSKVSYVHQDAIASVALTNAASKEDPDTAISSKLRAYPDFSEDLIIDLVNRSDDNKPSPVTFYDMSTWPSFEEIQNLRRSEHHGCSKHEFLMKKHRFQQQLVDERMRSQKDQVKTWVNINPSGYKASPILRYTTYQGIKLEPIIVPTHAKDQCPMCNLYRSNKVSTACPPNSPKANLRTDVRELVTIQEDDRNINADENLENSAPIMSVSPTDHFQDINKLEPITASSVAKTQGFRGSKPPISFRMCYNKGVS